MVRRFNYKYYLGVVAIIIIATSVMADCIAKFSWSPNTESNIESYTVYYGQVEGGPYSESIDVGRPSSINGRVYGTVTGLTCGELYYFTCTATNNQTGDSWVSGTEYSTDDLVSYNSLVYKCILDTVDPHTELPTNTTYWQQIKESAFSNEVSLIADDELASIPTNLNTQ